jgi:hypothetical protein
MPRSRAACALAASAARETRATGALRGSDPVAACPGIDELTPLD